MKTGQWKRVLIVLTVVSLVGLGVNAFAGRGGGGYGPGSHMRGYDCPYWGSDMGEEDMKKMDEARKAFFDGTRELRQRMYEKEMALQSELAKVTPDAEKAAGLQKEISELQAQFDQKHLEHVIQMRKINPDAGRGPMMGYGQRGSGGRGGCWR